MNWMNQCYSRLLVDNHITDCHAQYMTKYDPKEYVRLVKISGVESAMVYSCDHNGNCYYPTKVGHQHANLKGRNVFAETVDLLDAEKIVPVIYYTMIFHNDLWARHPEVRQHDICGVDHHGRYHYACPNHPGTAKFHQAQIAEVVVNPKIKGIFLDMTFWPMICCCDACREKFRNEYHLEIPEVIDWSDPDWVKFQRFRERSMAEFAQKMTDFIKNLRPDITVTHQFSPVLHGWFLGQSAGIANACDYCSGDFYGGKMQQRFAVKAFDAFTPKKPFEFMTSRCVSLRDHTSNKPDQELLLHALTTLANGGAYFFIDAINPDGTLEEKFYHTLRTINEKLAPFRQAVCRRQATLTGRVGVYFSMPSCVAAISGTTLKELSNCDSNNMTIRRNAILEEAMGMVRILAENHIPCQLVTESTADWEQFDTILVGNAAYLPETESARMRDFVRDGGTLIATGCTSLYDDEGNGGKDFSLSDVLGVHFSGDCTGAASYLSAPGERVFTEAVAPLVTAEKENEVVARVNLPDFPANDGEKYAAIHSNPPGLQDSRFAALVEHPFGKGRGVYLYSSILTGDEYSRRDFGRRLFAKYAATPVKEAENLPPSAEVTFLKDAQGKTALICIVNYQDDIPVIPLYQVKLTLELPGFSGKIIRVSDGGEVAYRKNGDLVTLTLDKITEAEFLELLD
ncbi:MAG: beta-galactosidase [Victivallaceae bacterium]|nr:beta-galactosidase [Victivallaceae bacterium]